jgi:hypothetical protein
MKIKRGISLPSEIMPSISCAPVGKVSTVAWGIPFRTSGNILGAIDNLESGGGSDRLYLRVTNGSTVLMQIGNSADNPATISTGNLRIHTTSCNN